MLGGGTTHSHKLCTLSSVDMGTFYAMTLCNFLKMECVPPCVLSTVVEVEESELCGSTEESSSMAPTPHIAVLDDCYLQPLRSSASATQ